MWLRYRQQQRKKRKWKERLAEKKRSQEGTERKEYHRAVRSLIIVFHKDNLKIWIGGYERQTITSVGYQLKCRLLLSCWNADAEAKSSQFLMFSNLGVAEGWREAQLISCVFIVSTLCFYKRCGVLFVSLCNLNGVGLFCFLVLKIGFT